MGQCSFKQDGNLNHGDRNATSKLHLMTALPYFLPYCLSFLANMSKNNFDFKYVIGRGGFGKVSVHSSKSNLFNALKYGFRSGEWSIVRLSRFSP